MPALQVPSGLSGYKPNDTGVLACAVIAGLLPHVRSFDQFQLPERVHDLAASLVSGRNINRRRSLQLVAAQRAATYLRRAALSEPWELEGVEFDTGSGRVDVTWRHTVTARRLFDEVKTSNRPLVDVDPAWLTQMRCYREAGSARYGDLFLGVRLVPLGSLHLTGVLDGSGWRLVPLSTTDPVGDAS